MAESSRGSGPASAPIIAAADDQRTPRAYRSVFDQLFEQGKHAVLSQTHLQDSPPTDGGRWGMSVVFTTPSTPGVALEEITRQAHTVAGAGHWPTGVRGSAHLTIRAIERHRAQIPPGDPLVARCAGALQRTVTHLQGPVRLLLTGLTLTPSGVMVCAYPIDSAADRFSAQLRTELGPDAWFEEQYERNIWYLSLLHFAGPLAQPQALIDWVRARRDLDIGTMQVDAAHVATFEHDGNRHRLLPLASVHLEQSPNSRAPSPAVPSHPPVTRLTS